MGGISSLRGAGSPQSIDWNSPILMSACFSCAILFAVSHHTLNLCLHGKAVDDVSVDQQWIARGGNAMAYIVKVLLVLATGTAYCQCVWKTVRGRPTKIGHFDSMFGVVDNIFEIRHLRFWFRRPVLILSVLVIWCLPLIVIITPGTLSVISKATSEPAVVSVQHRDYGSGLYGAAIVADNGTVFYGGARSYLKGPTMASLVETEILSVGSYSTNMTYSLDFYGPAVTCSKAGDQTTSQLSDIITQYQTSNETSLMYDTWVPKPNTTSNHTIVDGSIINDSDKNRDLRILDQTSPDAAKIYYTVAPTLDVQAKMDNPIYVIQCSLYNASWHLDFDVRRTGEQIVTPTVEFKNWMPGWSSVTPPLENNTETDIILDYAGLMETFGAITTGRLDLPNDPNLPFTQTSIALETSPVLFADVTPDPFTEDAMVTLQRTLETIFQNMTLSARYGVLPRQDLLSDTALLTFLDVNATSTFSRNVYDYKSRDLVIAYALAVVLTAACIVFAMLAIRDMGAVYSNNFSTAVRVTRGQECLDRVIVDDRDRSGAEPLPKRVADAYIWVGREQKIGMGMGRGRVGTDTSEASERVSGGGGGGRRWWGKRKAMDVECPLEKETVVAVREVKGAPEGNWI